MQNHIGYLIAQNWQYLLLESIIQYKYFAFRGIEFLNTAYLNYLVGTIIRCIVIQT